MCYVIEFSGQCRTVRDKLVIVLVIIIIVLVVIIVVVVAVIVIVVIILLVVIDTNDGIYHRELKSCLIPGREHYNDMG